MAARAVRSVLVRMRGPDGRLFAVWKDGRAHQAATLDDYAYFIWALTELYEAQYDAAWLEEAGALTRSALELFAGEDGGLYFTVRDAADLPLRGINAWDGAAPSGQSVMAMNLARLARLLECEEFEQRAHTLIASLAGEAAQMPTAFPFLLAAHDYLCDGGADVAVTQGEGAGALLRAASGGYRPYLTVRLVKTQGEGLARAHVCARGACYPPVTKAEQMAALL